MFNGNREVIVVYSVKYMIGYLRGTIVASLDQEIWVDVQGIGYRVRVNGRWSMVNGQDVEMFIHTAVREDAITLYGFATIDELQLFELLITVSGIGPKTALGIVSSSSADQIEAAIRQADVAFFTKVPGIGKKGAQRIIVDLKSKIGSLKEMDLSTDEEDDGVFIALKQFGFKPSDISLVLKKMDRTLPEQQQIKQGLQLLGKTRV